MTPDPTGSARLQLIERARKATSELRDAAREGRVIDFRKRDPLVLDIHHALDLAEELVAASTSSAPVDQILAVLKAVSERHEWTPGLGQCQCEAHYAARCLLVNLAASASPQMKEQS